jgi:hypothetical protein
MIEGVITAIPATEGSIDHNQAIRNCPICDGHLKARQRFCSGRCRVKAYWIRQIDKIIVILRDELHRAIDDFFEKMRKILVERLVK